MKPLIVIDMQNDFIDGVLGTAEAQAIVKDVADTIRSWDGPVFCTLDTHQEDYLDSMEGKYLPVVHCVEGTEGWKLNPEIQAAAEAVSATFINKPTFGSLDLPRVIAQTCLDPEEIHMAGICTDICVISNAMILKAAFSEAPLKVHGKLCAGVTPAQHDNALAAMAPCQVEVI